MRGLESNAKANNQASLKLDLMHFQITDWLGRSVADDCVKAV